MVRHGGIGFALFVSYLEEFLLLLFFMILPLFNGICSYFGGVWKFLVDPDTPQLPRK